MRGSECLGCCSAAPATAALIAEAGRWPRVPITRCGRTGCQERVAICCAASGGPAQLPLRCLLCAPSALRSGLEVARGVGPHVRPRQGSGRDLQQRAALLVQHGRRRLAHRRRTRLELQSTCRHQSSCCDGCVRQTHRAYVSLSEAPCPGADVPSEITVVTLLAEAAGMQVSCSISAMLGTLIKSTQRKTVHRHRQQARRVHVRALYLLGHNGIRAGLRLGAGRSLTRGLPESTRRCHPAERSRPTISSSRHYSGTRLLCAELDLLSMGPGWWWSQAQPVKGTKPPPQPHVLHECPPPATLNAQATADATVNSDTKTF